MSKLLGELTLEFADGEQGDLDAVDFDDSDAPLYRWEGHGIVVTATVQYTRTNADARHYADIHAPEGVEWSGELYEERAPLWEDDEDEPEEDEEEAGEDVA